jgi:hypothetical protein
LQVDEAQNMLDEALAEVRAEGLTAGRYSAYTGQTIAAPANAAKKV